MGLRCPTIGVGIMVKPCGTCRATSPLCTRSAISHPMAWVPWDLPNGAGCVHRHLDLSLCTARRPFKTAGEISNTPLVVRLWETQGALQVWVR